jgi:outer membrane protein TolC
VSRVALAVALAIGAALSSAVPAAGVTEAELVEAFLARDAPAQRAALLSARREAADLARASAPTWRLEALREESTSASTAFSTEALSVGLELELSRANATERRRAAAELAAQELAVRSARIDAVTELRAFVLSAWRAEREAALRRAARERVESLLDELGRLVEAGEQARFDLERLRAFSATGHLRARVATAAARAERARLAALTGREAVGLALAEPRALPAADALVELVRASHPLLRLLRQRVEEGGLAVDLAGQGHPGRLDLRAGYRRDDAPGVDSGDGYELEAAYTLPATALRRRDAALARGEAGARELALASAELRVLADVEASLARLEALGGLGGPSGGDVDAVREGSLRRYRAGEATLTELVDVLARLEERELVELQAEVARREARLELDRASGLVTAPELARLVEETLP